jgi:hypothetical protein
MKALAFSLLLSAAFAAHGQTPEFAVTHTTLSQSDVSFECKTSGTGHCYYMIVTSLCDEQMLPTGQKQRDCRYTKAADFALAEGEKKQLTNLPGDFQYCMKIEAKPVLAECMNSLVRR